MICLLILYSYSTILYKTNTNHITSGTNVNHVTSNLVTLLMCDQVVAVTKTLLLLLLQQH